MNAVHGTGPTRLYVSVRDKRAVVCGRDTLPTYRLISPCSASNRVNCIQCACHRCLLLPTSSRCTSAVASCLCRHCLLPAGRALHWLEVASLFRGLSYRYVARHIPSGLIARVRRTRSSTLCLPPRYRPERVAVVIAASLGAVKF